MVLSKKQKQLLFISLLIITGLFYNSCKTNPVAPKVDKFVFKVIVKDSNGNPVPGIRISSWNFMQDPQGFIFGKKNVGKSIQSAATSIEADIEQNSNVNVSLFDLDNNFVDTITNSYLHKGKYLWQWVINDVSPIKFYKCKLVAMDSLLTRVLFSDSVYMTLFQPDWNFTSIGWSNSNGVYETENQRLFPSSMDNFIPLKYCLSDDDTESYFFQFLDSVKIVLTDTTNNMQNIYSAHLSKNENIFEYTWDPSGSLIKNIKELGNSIYSAKGFKIKKIHTDYHWKLYQNFPNPFN